MFYKNTVMYSSKVCFTVELLTSILVPHKDLLANGKDVVGVIWYLQGPSRAS